MNRIFVGVVTGRVGPFVASEQLGSLHRLWTCEKPGGISVNGNESAKRRLLALWEAKRGARLMPARSDFDCITDSRPFLGHLMLIEVIEGGRDYRFRVFGSMIAALVGEEHQNKRLSDIAVEEARLLRDMFDGVVQSGRPVDFDHSGFRSRRLVGYQALVLPLAENGKEVDMILYLLSRASRHRQPLPATGLR